MNNYEQQANEFLKATNTAFKAKFLRYGAHFDSDQLEMRDIFFCTLQNGKHKFNFKFGQSISQSTRDGKNPPTSYDALCCLQKYEVGFFDDFCADFDFSTDSRSAYRTYKACMREWKNIEQLFTPDEIELLQEIQ